ncbi:bifunctional diaminohydroxyphosphoribosylaminopyrimidine deaminase/5-amino-6-(5-phosphoribosylamino)uracil reductase RibD [Saccharomonospora piscinae]|uniref:bifunctional diaminohydroxyphosphoribosylaminopyrimidine deaminase/5-amino-6-(5-phosphoribosylamino)uracil reductase RibD n=1 Tax=Saccharomonospora piscinae TaxID=687388 RepID=UPI0011059BC8|nr:bifunctional diaminohydroxyphosphoribosylaminopyrimidine deaminase/5-amino-6-(5-phosphoribosylamino)uracil reductase RibD [Saccharomonospora piscinae]TLW95372.1 bifunctional diaminohydroxyphosphoribosylaminopyrimidine deaminase/5-amino-6-(5-phosphoribosylamino)uracil reductase RibD [Saccharomonospora piscinae]
MEDALALSDAVRGTTSPNPPVGAVILDAHGHRVGAGATQPPPGPHAEVVALREAGRRARGGTAVVTLEPCAHHGRTPPCTRALLDAGVAAVRFAVPDPHPAASGGGEVLRAAGVDVEAGSLADEVAAGPLRAWLHRERTGRPHVTWKYAATLDGRVAAADGTSRWISGPVSRAEVHAIRAAADAVVVGTGTVLADDPWLTVRGDDGALAARQPLRVVVGTRGIPGGARVLDSAAETIVLDSHDPDEVLAVLGDRGVVDVLLEGGPTLAGAFVAGRRVDRLLAYVAPALLGAGAVALGPAGVSTVTEAHRWRVETATMSGEDVRISAVPVTGEGGD